MEYRKIIDNDLEVISLIRWDGKKKQRATKRRPRWFADRDYVSQYIFQLSDDLQSGPPHFDEKITEREAQDILQNWRQ